MSQEAEFVVRFEILPRWHFGLDGDDGALLPTGWKGSVDLTPGRPVPKIPRDPAEALTEVTMIGDIGLSLRDNMLSLTLRASNEKSAVAAATDLANRLARALGLERATVFFAIPDSITDEEGATRSLKTTWGRWARSYNLSKMRRGLGRALDHVRTADQVLDKALVYHEHAQFLMEQALFHRTMASRRLLLNSAFLSLWKAITVILGDPSSDKDYQSRFKTFGFPPKYWTSTVQPLMVIRNQEDVAHYSLDQDSAERVSDAYWKAERVCRDCIKRYSDHLGKSTGAGKP